MIDASEALRSALITSVSSIEANSVPIGENAFAPSVEPTLQLSDRITNGKSLRRVKNTII